MKPLLLAVAAFVHILTGYGQSILFPANNYYLLSHDTALQKMRSVVDSLHLEYRRSHVARQYNSIRQGNAHFVHMDSGNMAEAVRDIQQHISFTDFVEKYHPGEVDSNMLIIETYDTVYNPSHITVFRDLSNSFDKYFPIPGMGRDTTSDDDMSAGGRSGRWLFDYEKPYRKVEKGKFKAFYITETPSTRLIPDKYARLISYAHYMTDTSTGIFFKTARNEMEYSLSVRDWKHDYMGRFLRYLHGKIAPIASACPMDTTNSYTWSRDYSRRDSLVNTYVSRLAQTPDFHKRLRIAVQGVLQSGEPTDDEFEHYVGKFYSPATELGMKRNRTLFAACGNSNRALLYVMEIGALAAQTANWPVFVKTRLAILDDWLDYFFGADSARALRKTYGREIDQLGLNTPDFMLGMLLLTSDPVAHRYQGAVEQLGRFFEENSYRDAFETATLSAIADSQLDDANRLMMRDLFLNYAYYLKDKQHRLYCLQKLESIDKTLPARLKLNVRFHKERYEAIPE